MSKGKKFGEMSYFKPVAGTKIMKEYHDLVYEVEATAEGFICGVLFYKSLSALAPKITGHKTNDLKFFGEGEMTVRCAIYTRKIKDSSRPLIAWIINVYQGKVT